MLVLRPQQSNWCVILVAISSKASYTDSTSIRTRALGKQAREHVLKYYKGNNSMVAEGTGRFDEEQQKNK